MAISVSVGPGALNHWETATIEHTFTHCAASSGVPCSVLHLVGPNRREDRAHAPVDGRRGEPRWSGKPLRWPPRAAGQRCPILRLGAYARARGRRTRGVARARGNSLRTRARSRHVQAAHAVSRSVPGALVRVSRARVCSLERRRGERAPASGFLCGDAGRRRQTGGVEHVGDDYGGPGSLSAAFSGFGRVSTGCARARWDGLTAVGHFGDGGMLDGPSGNNPEVHQRYCFHVPP